MVCVDVFIYINIVLFVSIISLHFIRPGVCVLKLLLLLQKFFSPFSSMHDIFGHYLCMLLLFYFEAVAVVVVVSLMMILVVFISIVTNVDNHKTEHFESLVNNTQHELEKK